MTERTFETTGGLDLLEDREIIENCRSDPIHRTASLQPHGSFLQVDPGGRQILSAAANIDRYLDAPAEEVIGHRVDAFFADDAFPVDRPWPHGDDASRTHVLLRASAGDLLATLFPVDDTTGIELEPVADPGSVPRDLLLDVQPMLARLRGLASRRQLLQQTVRLVRTITGYDRVMLYRFGDEGHGAVVAEDRREDAHSYLGQHFPASDIPEPARRLYRKNGIRYIPDVDYEPVPVLGPEGVLERWDLDLTYSHLRGVPAVHRRYLRNMGVGASLSVSLLLDGDLWGMIACHDAEPHRVGRERQNLCELVGHTVGQQLARMRAEEKEDRRGTLDGWRSELESPSSPGNLFDQLRQRRDRVLSLMDASAFYLQLHSDSLWLTEEAGKERPAALLDYVSDRLATERQIDLRSIAGDVDGSWDRSEQLSGLLALRLGTSDRHFCCWLRPEFRETVRWGGDPRHPVRTGPDGRLHPRSSFEEWTQIVAERSRPWTDLDRFTAREMARALEEMVIDLQSRRLRDANRELASRNEALEQAKQRLERSQREREELLERMKELARTDDLTGLANRRELMRRLREEVDRARRYGGSLSIVLLDLDRFKPINDRFGHQVGDRVLQRIGDLLDEETRGPDLAGRYGGEEFLLVLPASDGARAARAAQRLLERVRELTFRSGGGSFGITCSAGVAELTEAEEDADEMIQRADTALYEAKEQGRDMVVVL